MTPATRARIVFDPPATGSLDVKVFNAAGELVRVIPGALLAKRVQDHREPPKISRGDAVTAHVPMVKAKSRAGRP